MRFKGVNLINLVQDMANGGLFEHDNELSGLIRGEDYFAQLKNY
jgi:hypothetical protein